MTVYELIQHLSKYPANCDVRILMYTENEHMEHYLVDSSEAGQEWANIYAEPLRLEQNWDSTVVTLECQSEDL